jgi:hypothetical protein
MSTLLGRFTVKKVVISVLTGIAVFIVSWFYLNSYYTLTIEDDLLSRETFFIHNLVKPKPQKNERFVFISTGKDLNLIDDTGGVGNVAVSDRYKLYRLLHAINNSKAKPKFVLLDLQFYYPYTYSIDDSVQQLVKKSGLNYHLPDKSFDDSLQTEIGKMPDKLAISVLLDSNKIQKPLYKSSYGIADYKTYGSFLNKFRLYYDDLGASSMPALIHQKVNGAVYSGRRLTTFCNRHLCFNYIWPNYYYDEADVKADSTFQEYHLGSLMSLIATPAVVEQIFKDKIIFIGNFEDDVHDTPAGRIPGTIVLADIYLSLLNGKHLVSFLWVLFVVALFSCLSYFAIYNELPDVKFKFGFAFAEQISSFLKEYVSYVGVLLLISVVSLLIFNITISLFLPAFIFSILDLLIKRKYKTKHEKS